MDMAQENRPTEPDELLSAEVVMHGQDPIDLGPITSTNLAQHQPDPDRAAQVRRWFEHRGFTTSEVQGVSFSLTGPRTLFDDTFSAHRYDAGVGPDVGGIELPLPEMPEQFAGIVDCVTFSPPPDFGPTSY